MSIVLTNAKIYTENEDVPWADTIVINGETIAYVGNGEKDKWGTLAEGNAEVYDMNGKMIIPGIVDSHVHPAMTAQCSWHVKTVWTYDVNELLEFIKDYVSKHPVSEKPFLYFEYYPSVMFDEKGPRKELLDTVVSDRPCLVQDFGEHMAWVNSKMIEALEVTKKTPDPVPGLVFFARDENGEPTGFVKEMAWLQFAENLYRNIGWRPPVEMTPELMMPFFDYFLSHGVTAMAEGFLEGEHQLKAMAQLEKEGRLHTYFDGSVRCDNYKELPNKLAEAQIYQTKYGSKHIKINTMKVFMDGTNESGNCCVVEPFSNDPTKKNHGITNMSEDEFTQYLLYCNKHNFDVHVHVVGDGSFRLCCNAYENAKNLSSDKWSVQMILAHCELVHPDDMLRPAKLGITINWTPRWSGGCYGEKAKIFLGEERWNQMYQFNQMIENGTLVSFSSDLITWNKIDRANPFYGMQIGHTRVDIADPLDSCRYPGSVRPPESAKISREALLKGYTINSARQMRWDHIMGSLEVGKLANLAVISDNFFEVDPFKIRDIGWETVIFEGKIVRGKI